MAKVYSSPIKVPEFDFNTYEKDEARYIDDLKKWVKSNVPKSKYAGEIVKFPHADGYAQYMIMSLKPAKLIHLPLGDAWQIPDAYERGLTSKEIKLNVDSGKELQALFT